MGEVYLLLTFISLGDPSSFLVESTLLGQIENTENFTKMMVKYYTRIIHREIKKGLPGDVFIYLFCVSV